MSPSVPGSPRKSMFQLLVEGVTDYAIFMLDTEGRVLTWNEGARRMKGYSAEEIIGEHFSRFYAAEAVQRGWPEHELKVATAEGRFEDEGWRLRKDGTQFWANVIITALRGSQGELRGFAKVTRDLTERTRLEALAIKSAQREALLDAERKARDEAGRAARLKDEFLATLSHELRTPLSAILGWAQLLARDRSLAGQTLRGVQAIERNARAQVQLIEDLLDLSRIMSGRLRLEVQPVALADVVRSALESIEPAADAKGVRLESVLDPLAGAPSGDPARLQQVAWNLLSNAVKFTPRGGRVQVVLRRVNSHIELSVSDTGIGIAPNYLPYVFDRFSQNDGSTTRRQGGLGLGLAISKQLVELHGGTLTAESPGEGHGARFTVALPTAVLREEGESADPFHPTWPSVKSHDLLPELSGVKVLVVDDELDARELIQQVLEQRGASVTTAGSGQEALNVLEHARPDVLLSDIGMPDMDGYQLMRSIREKERPGERLAAAAITAYARPQDRTEAILAGYQLHIAKPLQISELVVVVASLVGRT